MVIPQGLAGWTAGICNDDQVRGWEMVTDSVHRAGGRFFLQLWHCGRVSDLAEFSTAAAAPVAAERSVLRPVA